MADQTLYRYVGPDGVSVIVSDLSSLTPAQRAKAEALRPEQLTPASLEPGTPTHGGVPGVFDVRALHPTSVAVGALGMLLFVVVWQFVSKRGRLFRFLAVALLATALGAFYIGTSLRMAGLGSNVVDSPTRVLDEARAARDAANRRGAVLENMPTE